MPRHRKPRWIGCEPPVTAFLPAGGPPAGPGRVDLTVDEWESLRLADALNLDQEAAAARMGVSQSTFQRLLATARRKTAQALTQGWVIAVGGGSYRLVPRHGEEGGGTMRHGGGMPGGCGARSWQAAGGRGPGWQAAGLEPPHWQDRQHLERMATHLEERLRMVRRRLQELGGEPGEKPEA
ncbi:MAG: DUF134 domain-containing protein [Bacillota bacterium]|nr:DUF134 domain-containing protein [Bacillota bacterium]